MLKPAECLRFHAYLFDIDGTLLNSRDEVHYRAFHFALERAYGIRDRIDSVPVHGNTDPGILWAVAENAGVSREVFIAGLEGALQDMRQSVLSNRQEMKPELCPGIPALLEELAARHKLLGLVSGNLEAIAWAKLEAAGIAKFFAFGSFSDMRSVRAQIFADGRDKARARLGKAQAEVCIVGDTPRDIAAARDCGLPVIAVATGIYTAEQLRANSPDFCAGCCAELLK
ncbi:MAG: HAD family hydrolase [Acidobacteria bacterium]|nr:HAD family hydrolase [Acidobacteriota bacterium]